MSKGKPSAPPPIPAPPPAQSKAAGERGTFDQFINGHKQLKPYASQIWQWANYYGGVTPTQLAALLFFESGGQKGARSSVGALGLAQIFDNTANPTNDAGVPFFRKNRTISAQDKTNPVFAIQYAAWRMSGAVEKYGSIDAAYLRDYNPGYKGSVTPISSLLPKGYVGTAGTPIDTAATKSVTTSQVTSALKDPWVVLTGKGTIGFVNSANPPKNAVTYGGTPITQSEYTQVWKQTYSSTFEAYTGRKATAQEIVQILKQAPSVYALSNKLAGEKSFVKSPVYKQHAPGLVAIGKSVLGNDWQPSGGIIRQAIAENWDQATFEGKLRSSPAYLKSPEFKTNLAQNTSTFQAIYGTDSTTDMSVQNALSEKTQAGWTPDELAAWARQQPAYKLSPEYQSKQLSFMQQLGLITGGVPTLSGQAVDQILNSSRQAVGAPYSSPGSQQRAGKNVGGAVNS